MGLSKWGEWAYIADCKGSTISKSGCNHNIRHKKHSKTKNVVEKNNQKAGKQIKVAQLTNSMRHGGLVRCPVAGKYIHLLGLRGETP